MDTNDVIALTEQLVRIESVNPQLDATGSGEAAIAAYVLAWGQENGLVGELIDHENGRVSVILRYVDAADAPTLLLCGHLDTVGVGSMTEPLTPRIDGDRMYGRGTYDMKAGLAAVLMACRQAAREKLAVNVVVAAVADEEHGSMGIQEVLEHLGPDFTADAAIVTEPTELAIGAAHKGFVWSQIDVAGRAAHGSRPHLGVDAIVKAGAFLVRLEEYGRELALTRHMLLGPGVVHASLISGGQEASTIPDSCQIVVERRTLPGETAASFDAELQQIIDACAAADPDFSATTTTLMERPPLETDVQAAVVEDVGAAHHAVSGQRPEVVGMSYWADSAFIAARGIPTVLYGPGGDGAHAEVEWVSLADTRQCAAVLTGVARAMSKRTSYLTNGNYL